MVQGLNASCSPSAGGSAIAANKAIGAKAVAVLRKFVKAWHVMRRKRRTITELSALTDHQLKDIGLTRGEIKSVAERVSAMNVF